MYASELSIVKQKPTYECNLGICVAVVICLQMTNILLTYFKRTQSVTFKLNHVLITTTKWFVTSTTAKIVQQDLTNLSLLHWC